MRTFNATCVLRKYALLERRLDTWWREPRPTCATPATVVATLLVFDNAGAGAPVEKGVGWAVPDELIDQLNAAPQPL